jgi:hypothetical protein
VWFSSKVTIMSVLFMKFVLVSSGSRNLRVQVPATVTVVS